MIALNLVIQVHMLRATSRNRFRWATGRNKKGHNVVNLEQEKNIAAFVLICIDIQIISLSNVFSLRYQVLLASVSLDFFVTKVLVTTIVGTNSNFCASTHNVLCLPLNTKTLSSTLLTTFISRSKPKNYAEERAQQTADNHETILERTAFVFR